MKAIILVGGLGTRLRSVLPDLPKPMAPLQDKPFLAYLLDYLQEQGITDVVFSVHYLREKIQAYFQSQYAGIRISYAEEAEPLGTGGAMLHSLSVAKTSELVFVLNGDTFVQLDYRAMYAQHAKSNTKLTMALRAVDDCLRYGKVITERQDIVAFREKGEAGAGLINAGVYLLNPDLFSDYDLPVKFSFENDFLLPHLSALQPQAFIANDYFIDIGIPDDYARAQRELPGLLQSTQMPKISIIIPVLNREDTIEKSLQSVVDQHYENVELIVMDGGSTDKTVDIIKRYASHITYWHSQRDGSAILAYNAGIKMATGDLIAILMGDDWYEPGTLQKIGETFIANPTVDMVTCGGRIVSFDAVSQQYKTQWSFNRAKDLKLSFYNVCFAASAICCRFITKSLYQRIGLYESVDTSGKHYFSNDKEFLLRAILANAKDVFTNSMGYNYLAHAGSSTFGNNRANILRLFQEHMQMAQTYLAMPSLPIKYKWLLHYWYCEQSARLFVYSLVDKNIAGALRAAKDGLARYHIFWPLAFCCAAIRVALKRLNRI